MVISSHANLKNVEHLWEGSKVYIAQDLMKWLHTATETLSMHVVFSIKEVLTV